MMTKWSSILSFGIATIFAIQGVGIIFGNTVSTGIAAVALIISITVLVQDGLNSWKEFSIQKEETKDIVDLVVSSENKEDSVSNAVSENELKKEDIETSELEKEDIEKDKNKI